MKKTQERFMEFLLVGVVLGVIEDLIAVKISTGTSMKPEMVIPVLLVAIPFAAFSELVVDREDISLPF